MPSFIVVNGENKYRAGSYVSISDSTQQEANIAGGDVCLVGDFPLFESGVPYVFNTNTELQKWLTQSFQNNAEVKDIKHAFAAPLLNSSLTPSSLTMVNVRPNTQASRMLKWYTGNNLSGPAGIRLKSKFWGKAGLNISSKLSADKLEINESGSLRETLRFTSASNPVTIEYVATSPRDYTFTTLEVEVTSDKLEILYAYDVTNANTVNVNLPHNGTVTVDGADGADLNEGNITITGINASNGSQETEILSGTTEALTSTKSFQRIVSIQNEDSANITVSGKIISTDLDEITDVFNTLRMLTDEDSNFIVKTRGTIIAGESLDRLANTSVIAGSPVSLTTFNADVLRACAGSKYIEAEKVNNIKSVADATFFSHSTGGTENEVILATDWDTYGLTPIKTLGVHILVSTSQDPVIHEKFRVHCRDAAIIGRERNAWVCTTDNQSISSIYNTFVKELNDRNMAVVCQTPKWSTNNTSSPMWTLALLCACVQGATSIAEPLTLKDVTKNLQKVSNSAINLQTDINEAIENSIVLMTDSRTSQFLQIERSVTTYREDLSHIVYTEVTANESLNACLRDLRNALQKTIGGKASSDQLSRVLSLATSRLKRQKDQQMIEDFRNLTAVLDGDIINLGFDLAVMRPQNFLNINVNLVR